MYPHEDKNQLPQGSTPRTRECAPISTARIMRAVEEQRRVSQQLEDLRLQQKQRTAYLSRAGLKFIAVLWCLSWALAGGFVLLLFMEPVLLDRTLNALGDFIALVVICAGQMRPELSLLPSSSWVLSVAALIVVLMMGLWIRLMRHPQDG